MRLSNLTTLIYITSEDRYLFIKKTRKGDFNYAKYLGIGGHFETGESPEDCVLRELYEESGLKMSDIEDFSYRGLVTFVNDICEPEYMHVFTASLKAADTPLKPCDEGELIWVPKDRVSDLPIWEGDKKMFELLDAGNIGFFTLKLTYSGEVLTDAKTNIY